MTFWHTWQLGTLVADAVPLLLAIAAAVSLSYAYCTRHYGHWERLGVPCTDPTPLLGHFAEPTLGRRPATAVIDSLYRRFRSRRYFGVYQLRRPVLVVRDPELVHAVLTKEFGSFHDRLAGAQSFQHDPLFHHLANLRGDRWRAVRSKLNPTFTVSKLRSMFGDLRSCTEQLADKLSELTSGGQGIRTRINSTTVRSWWL